MNKLRTAAIALIFSLSHVAAAETSIELSECWKVMGGLSKQSHESRWINPGRKIFGKPTEEWTSSDFSSAREYAKSCLKEQCQQSKSWCKAYEETSYNKVINILEKAPKWAQEARKTADLRIAEDNARNERKKRQEDSEKQEIENALAFFEKSIIEMQSLPDTQESILRLDAIKQEERSYRRAMWDSGNIQITNEWEAVLRKKRLSLQVANQAAKSRAQIESPLAFFEKSIIEAQSLPNTQGKHSSP